MNWMSLIRNGLLKYIKYFLFIKEITLLPRVFRVVMILMEFVFPLEIGVKLWQSPQNPYQWKVKEHKIEILSSQYIS